MSADVADASTLELVGAAEAIARELAGREATETGHAAMEIAETLGTVVDLFEAALAPLIRRVDDTGVFAEFGFSSPGAWLRTRLGMRDGRAAERLRLARHLPRLRQVAKRLAGGDLSYGFAAAISDAVARLDRQDVEPAEQILLGLADAGHTAGQLAKHAARITDLINEHRGRTKEPDDSKRGFSRSWLTKSRSLDGGSWLKGWLGPEHTALFEQVLGPLAEPKASGDDRDLGQRTADALMAVLSQGHKGAGVTIIIDLKAFVDATGDTGPFTARPGRAYDEHGDAEAGRRAGHLDGAADYEPDREPDGEPLGKAAGRPDRGPNGEPDDDVPGPGGCFDITVGQGFSEESQEDEEKLEQGELEQGELEPEVADDAEEDRAIDGGPDGVSDPPFGQLTGDLRHEGRGCDHRAGRHGDCDHRSGGHGSCDHQGGGHRDRGHRDPGHRDVGPRAGDSGGVGRAGCGRGAGDDKGVGRQGGDQQGGSRWEGGQRDGGHQDGDCDGVGHGAGGCGGDGHPIGGRRGGDHPGGHRSSPVTCHAGSDPPRKGIEHRRSAPCGPGSRRPHLGTDGPDSPAALGERWRPDGREMAGSRFVRPRPAARLLDGTPISPERARQIALNAGINVLLLGESHLPLRLGRTVRFVTPAQRKVLLALYETCCVQGCRIPAHLCEIHHIDGGWKLGTPTDIDKLVPACGWHNRWVEAHADQVEHRRDAHGRTVLRLRPPRGTQGRRSAESEPVLRANRADRPDGADRMAGRTWRPGGQG